MQLWKCGKLGGANVEMWKAKGCTRENVDIKNFESAITPLLLYREEKLHEVIT